MKAIAILLVLGLTPLPAKAAIAWTDPILTANVTKVKAVHVRELRTYANAARQAVGLASYAWQDPLLTTDATKIRVIHISQLRTAISQVYTTKSQPAPTFTDDPLIANMTKIRAKHINELRLAIENAPVDCVPHACTAAEPACGQTTSGTSDDCGTVCTKTGAACGSCVVNSCDAAEPACGQTTTGVDNCGTPCSKTGDPCAAGGTWTFSFADTLGQANTYCSKPLCSAIDGDPCSTIGTRTICQPYISNCCAWNSGCVSPGDYEVYECR